MGSREIPATPQRVLPYFAYDLSADDSLLPHFAYDLSAGDMVNGLCVPPGDVFS